MWTPLIIVPCQLYIGILSVTCRTVIVIITICITVIIVFIVLLFVILYHLLVLLELVWFRKALLYIIIGYLFMGLLFLTVTHVPGFDYLLPKYNFFRASRRSQMLGKGSDGENQQFIL